MLGILKDLFWPALADLVPANIFFALGGYDEYTVSFLRGIDVQLFVHHAHRGLLDKGKPEDCTKIPFP